MGDSENSNWTAYSSELVAKVVLCDFAAEDWIKLAAIAKLNTGSSVVSFP
ncbi:hypothetical protein [Pseudomonas fluorescens]|nr:hypothetical protein [Pseudomonas fluorescens]